MATCRPADQPLILHIHTLAYHILNHSPLYLPTCRATSYSIFYIYLYLTLYLSICRPADPPLILNIIYIHKGYSIFSPFIHFNRRAVYLSTCLTYLIYLEVNLYLVIALSICRPADPPTHLSSLIYIHRGLSICRIRMRDRSACRQFCTCRIIYYIHSA